ncbi:alkaline ceramidase ydc1 [Dipsacomyces acuminosporus]|nr:alkaline ceramidase ydc1 [Dipsacomyces acuminosporus]
MAPLARTGYWGDVTSSMDWCEENYEWTPYIAEFFNSWSSLAMVILGEACAYMNPTGHPGYSLLSRSITVVGIGSWLFHATLKYSTQMTDELPMLWSAIIAFYLSITTQFNVNHTALKLGLSLWTVVVTMLTARSSGRLQFFLFQASFNILTPILAYLTWRAKKDLERAKMGHVAKLYSKGIKWAILAGTLWMIDTNLCTYVNGKDAASILPFNLQLHAWWHALVSLGLVYLVVLLMCHYCLAKGIPFKFRFVMWIFPYIYTS